MSVQPFYNPKFRAFDSNGDPLSGGLLYSYAAGTSTPLATYTTRAGSVANANPVVLDADGEADVWTTPGVDYKFELRNSAGVVQWTVDNVPSPAQQSAATETVVTDPGGRLSLTAGVPVTTSDVTGATTVFYVPYKSDKVPLYDGSGWALYSIGTQLSQATADTTKSPAGVANNSNYDLFVWNDSGTLRLSRGPLWTSDTGRGSGAGTTELERVNGRLVNKVSVLNGPGAQRGLYVGTIRSDGSAQVNDSLAKRHVWNMYSRVVRPMRVTESTNGWSYQTATFRQANASAANQLDLVRGLDEDAARAQIQASHTHDPSGGTGSYVAVGLDSTTTPATGCLYGAGVSSTSGDYRVLSAQWLGLPGLGRRFLAWLERGNGNATNSWIGDLNAASVAEQAGIHGETLA